MTTRKPRWGGGSNSQGPKASLRLLATTDLHAQLVPWDFYADRAMPGRGLSCLAGLIAAARAEAGGALLFDNGDFLTGGPLSDALPDDLPEPAGQKASVHPMIKAMNILRYDAVGLGNHEFSRGLDYLNQSLSAAQFPVLGANLRRPDGEFTYMPRVMLTQHVTDQAGQGHAVRVGVTSALPPQTMIWEKFHLSGRMQIGDILANLRVQVRRLRDDGADVVVVLAHSGLAPDGSRTSRMRANVAQAVAALPGVDVVVAGHTHDALPAQPWGATDCAALVQPGAMASHLGVVDLELQQVRGRWRVLGHCTSLRTAPTGADAQDDPQLAELAQPALLRMRQRLDQVVGHSKVRLDTHFALIGRSSAVHYVGRAMCDHLADLLGRDEGRKSLPILSAVAATRSGGRGGPENYASIAPGALRERDLGSLVPFDDRLAATEIRGADLLRWLEHSAGIFHQIAPGARDEPLLDPEVPGFLFDVIEGLSYQIDLSVPAGQGRIRDLGYCGSTVGPADRFVLATSSHRLGGGGGLPLPPPRYEIALPSVSLRDVMRQAVRLPIRPKDIACPGWRFVPMPGTSVTFDTAPEAVTDDPALDLLGPAPGGFQRFRLRL